MSRCDRAGQSNCGHLQRQSCTHSNTSKLLNKYFEMACKEFSPSIILSVLVERNLVEECNVLRQHGRLDGGRRN